MKHNYIKNLSKDFSNLFENSNDYDVKIIVGKEPNIVEFKAHSLFLSSRSNYFQRELSTRKDDKIIIFNEPNISPLAVEVLIKYIYTGILSTDDDKISLVDIVIAADEFELSEIYQQLEELLLENESAWRFPRDFITICQNDYLTNLYRAAFDLVCRNPKVIFESKEFLRMEEAYLIKLLKGDNLELKEIEIWEYLIKWGIENTDSILDDDLTRWTSMDFKDLEKTLHNCIPHIRFFQMSLDDYSKVRASFKNILPDGLDDEVFQYLLNHNSRFHNPKFSFNILPLRESAYPFYSKIINSKDAALIASWIDKKLGIKYQFKDMPFEFKLIFRASRDGFKANNFHNNCDNQGPTVVIIKVQNSGEIIGGYNPLDWRCKTLENERDFLLHNRDFYNDKKCETSNSFIFSLKNPILSRVVSKKEAIIWCRRKGPCFGLQDLWIRDDESFNDVFCTSKQHSYKEKIINRETFGVEDYEVFQIIDKRSSFCSIN